MQEYEGIKTIDNFDYSWDFNKNVQSCALGMKKFILIILAFSFVTAFAQKDSVSVDLSKTSEKRYTYSTDTIPPTINFYISHFTIADLLILPAFGAFLFDFTLEKENSYNGSLIFNLTTFMLFFDIQDNLGEKDWEGFRSVTSLGVGYRYYLGRLVMPNYSEPRVKHRNVPINSFSPYIQAIGAPVFKFANDKSYGSKESKSSSFDIGFSSSVSLGLVWNMFNFLWDINLLFGYQYWSDNARNILIMDFREKKDSMNFHYFINGMDPKGFYWGFESRFGF